MAENRIFTKIALKYNDYAYWTTGAGKDYTPLKGEVCFCAIPAGNAAATTAPTVLFKVGNGTDKFSALKWASALAADVHEWAKATEEEHKEWLNTNHANTDTQYFFSTDGDKLVVKKALYTNGVKGTEVEVGKYEFLTAAEVAETLKGYYTRGEVDDLIQDVEAKLPTSTDYGVLSVAAGDDTITIGGTAQDPTIKVTANKFEPAGAVAILQDALETGEVTVEKATEANTAATAGKVAKKLTVTIGNTNIEFDGSSAKNIDVDDAIAAAIEAEGHPAYAIAKVTTTTGYSATYQLTKDGTAFGEKINIPKDMVVSKGEVITYENAGAWGNAGTYIVLTLANATNDTLYIPAAGLIEYVTSGSTAEDQIIVNVSADHKITATIGEGKVGMTELAQEVKNAIDANPYENHIEVGEIVDGEDNIKLSAAQGILLNSDYVDINATQINLPGVDSVYFDNKKAKVQQTAVTDQNLSGATVVKGIAQNANGEITVSTRNLTAEDIGAVSSTGGDYSETFRLFTTEDLTIATDSNLNLDGAIYFNGQEIGNLATKDKIVEGDINGTIGTGKITNFAEEVAKVKVDKAADADTLGGKAASDYALAENLHTVATTGSIYDVEEGNDGVDKDGATVRYFILDCNW